MLSTSDSSGQCVQLAAAFSQPPSSLLTLVGSVCSCSILTASLLPPVPPAVPGTPQYVDEQFLSRLFLFVALVIMFWLLIA